LSHATTLGVSTQGSRRVLNYSAHPLVISFFVFERCYANRTYGLFLGQANVPLCVDMLDVIDLVVLNNRHDGLSRVGWIL
jgi:hypothetical protein